MVKLCACGKPLHYKNKVTERMVQMLVDELGEYIAVTVDGKTFSVQRHYIALHGIKDKDLDKLGFSDTIKKKRREKDAWYCQNCSEKHYETRKKSKFVVCEKCFEKLREVDNE